MFAAYHGHTEVVNALIDADCDLNARGSIVSVNTEASYTLFVPVNDLESLYLIIVTLNFLLFLQLSPLSIHGHYLLSCCVDCKDYLFLSFPPFSLSCFHYLPFIVIVITFIA